jgi:hypothetical protein
MIYWWWLIFILAITQNQTRRRRQMGPRIQIDPEEFLSIAQKEKGLIIKKQGQILFQGTTYVIRSGDYYYYTVTKQHLTIPSECQVKEVKHILL